MFVIATAGHVDHGKSTLVRALTGMEPDRWSEERRRGMTIDLGYAWTVLPGGAQVAFVDVPGHQRFVSNLLAGVGPVPAVLLVVAADAGWGQQTTEHVAMLAALGVEHGVLAVTRSDLADGEAAIRSAREHLDGSGLDGIDAVAVSGRTGTGLDRLRAAIEAMVLRIPAPRSSATRLWVDRVFTVSGAGTVVTGTLSSGWIQLGDGLVVSSTGQLVHVRKLETLKSAVDSVTALARVAINVRGVDRTGIHRGDALVAPGRWADVDTMDVRLIGASSPIPRQLMLHIGSAAVSAAVRPLGPDLARLRLAHSLPLHVGERGILRDPGRPHAVAGFVVLDTDPVALARRGAAAQLAAELGRFGGGPDPAGEVRRRGAVRHDRLIASGQLEPDQPAPTKTVVAGRWLVDAGRWSQWRAELARVCDRWAAEHALNPGLPRPTALQQLELPDPAVLDALVDDSAELISDGDGIHRPSASAALPALVRASLDDLMRRLRQHPFDAPEAPELTAGGLTERYLAVAVKNGELVRIGPGVYLLPESVDEALRRLTTLPQPFTTSAARQVLATTRRVAIPLLEYLDARGHSRRTDGQHRELRGRPGRPGRPG